MRRSGFTLLITFSLFYFSKSAIQTLFTTGCPPPPPFLIVYSELREYSSLLGRKRIIQTAWPIRVQLVLIFILPLLSGKYDFYKHDSAGMKWVFENVTSVKWEGLSNPLRAQENAVTLQCSVGVSCANTANKNLREGNVLCKVKYSEARKCWIYGCLCKYNSPLLYVLSVHWMRQESQRKVVCNHVIRYLITMHPHGEWKPSCMCSHKSDIPWLSGTRCWKDFI